VGSGSRDLYAGINTLTARFNSGMISSGDQVVQSKTYKVGDFGPAGGIVFYDKGTFSAGWRYLEAAPPETEFIAQWGAYEKTVGGTGTSVGVGKRNTQVIMEFLQRQGETGRAAQLCAALNFDGFKDWFLPSRDELNLMYTNLKTKGLGGFSDNWYWSSSEYLKYLSTHAWVQRFSDGNQDAYYKHHTGSVRAVRAF
jgi:hypothetical protein